MKKAGLLAAAVLAAASFSLLSGFDNSATVEDVLTRYSEASAEQTEVVADTVLKADVNLEVKDLEMALGIKADADFYTAVTTDPLAIQTDGSFNASVMGEQIGAGVSLYMVTEEDGSLGMYTKVDMEGEEPEWDYENGGDMTELMEQIKNMNFNLAELPIEFTLADGPVDVNGISCYQVTSTLGVEDVLNLVNFAMQKAGEVAGEEIGDLSSQVEGMEEMAAMFNGIYLNIELDIDAESYKTVKVRLDTEGTNWEAVAPMIAALMDMTDDEGNLMNLSIGVNELYLEMVYDNDAAAVIEVPAEALAAKEAE